MQSSSSTPTSYNGLMKPKPCKHCQSELHTSLKCFNAPRKPVKRPVGGSKVKKIKTPKKKTMSRSQLVKRLDSVYSQYIRLKNADSDGYCICVTSGKRIYWKEIQNGHFYSRKYLPTRWDDTNCHPQSVADNIFLRGNYINYTRYMIDRYGRDYVDELERKAKSGAKISTPELREKLEYYSGKVAELSTSKHK